MVRRNFLGSLLAGSALAAQTNETSNIVIERPNADNARKGKVLALITPHLDDGPIFAGGTIAKLLKEGCTGYFIRTSNDEKDSFDLSLGETILANERDTAAVVRVFGFQKSFDLSYRNHRMDEMSPVELRARLIFLFRLLKVDVVFSYDPWGHYEENPDHYVTAKAVEAACWMSGGKLDFPEHFAAGLQPHSVSEKYYFARGPQLVNRVVDIAPTLDRKLAAIGACRTMIHHMVKDLQVSLAEQKLRLPMLSGDEHAANAEYIKLAFASRAAEVGRQNGVDYAEAFHYIGPDLAMQQYIERTAVPL